MHARASWALHTRTGAQRGHLDARATIQHSTAHTLARSLPGVHLALYPSCGPDDGVTMFPHTLTSTCTLHRRLGYLWTYPSSVTDDTGLGGGITYAFNPKLCDMLNNVNSEDTWLFSLVDCDSFRSSVAAAFNTWASNSRHIKFVDVTKECDALGKNFGPPTDAKQVHQYPHGGCPLAEIWVTSLDTSASSGRRLTEGGTVTAAGGLYGLDLAHHITGRSLQTTPSLQPEPDMNLEANVAVATALSHARYSNTFRYTNGERPYTLASDGTTKVYGRQVVETYAGTFSFNLDAPICWYLDSQFCSGIHKLKAEMGSAASAKLLVDGITFGLMALGILFYSILLIRLFCKFTGMDDRDDDGDGAIDADEDGDGKVTCCERVQHVMHEIADWNPLALALFVSLIVCPPLFSSFIFAPCFNCYDFEAAATHEIGHFLGLGHPDNIPANWASSYSFAKPNPGENSYNSLLAAGTRPIAGQTCFKMWDDVKAGVPADSSTGSDMLASSTAYPYRPATMQAFTQHNPNTCLADDDLEGLNVLYPDCGEQSLVHNVCHNVQKNIGFVRIIIYLLSPFIVALVGVMLFASIFHYWERGRNEQIRKERAELKVANATLTSDLARASLKTDAAINAAKKHKAAAEANAKTAKRASIAAKLQVAAAKAKNVDAQDVEFTSVTAEP